MKKAILLAVGLAVGGAGRAWGQAKGGPAERIEAQTLARGVALRRPGEADSAFMRRVLPVSYPDSGHRVAYAWRPSTFGKQLLFVVIGDNGPKTALFILDPYQPATYAVQRLDVVINGGCDLASSLEAIFFADINHDGQKELLALGFCYAQEQSEDKDDNGRIMHRRKNSGRGTGQNCRPPKASVSLTQGPAISRSEANCFWGS